MRRVSIWGALFMFMQRGEKLTESDQVCSNVWPDYKYVLWPRAEFWDVRFLTFKNGKSEWVPIADKPFADESTVWQAASEHWFQQKANVFR